MRELDETKVYILDNLNIDQLKQLHKINEIGYTIEDFVEFSKRQAYVYINNCWCFTTLKYNSSTDALELFYPQLKIGDTFEYNGFVCEVKEEVKKWYKIEDNKNNKVAFEKLCKQDILDIEKLPYTKLTEITNKEFIKQLEENAR